MIFFTQCRMECITLLRHPWQSISLLSSAALFYIILHFGLPADAERTATLPALLFGTLIITLINTTSHAFDDDVHYGRIAHWHYGGLAHEWIIIAKNIAYLLILGLPLCLIFTGLLWLDHGAFSFSELTHIFTVICLSTFAIIPCGLFSAAMSITFPRNTLAATLLSLPFLISVIIFGAGSLSGDGNALLLLGAIGLVMPVLCCWLSGVLVKGC